MVRIFYFETDIGRLAVADGGGAVVRLLFDGEEPKMPCAEETTPLALQAAHEINDYLAGHRNHFDVPFLLSGTPFQMSVWGALTEIPYGQVRTYGQIAAQIKKPRAHRAVGGANHVNPVPIIVPCHRVIGADGSLTGFGGGLDVKKYLLALEEKNK
jgi:methylated-DNA-[protein]-cysteine S-methyltransferase